MPDVIAAQRAGISPKAVRVAREDWGARGDLTIHERGTKGHPALFTLAASPYPARLDDFDPARYAIRRFDLAGEQFKTWATQNQAHIIATSISRCDDDDLARRYADYLSAEGDLIDSTRVLRALQSPRTGIVSHWTLDARSLAAAGSLSVWPIPA